MSKRLSLLLLVLGLTFNFSFGQTIIGDSLIIQGKKGTLAKVLKSKKYTNITKIKVIGDVGEKDFLGGFLSSRDNLVSLDLSDATYILTSTEHWELTQRKRSDGGVERLYISIGKNLNQLKLFKKATYKGEVVPVNVEIYGKDREEISLLTVYFSKDMSISECYASETVTKGIVYADGNVPASFETIQRFDILEVPRLSDLEKMEYRCAILNIQDINECIIYRSDYGYYPGPGQRDIPQGGYKYWLDYLKKATTLKSYAFDHEELLYSIVNLVDTFYLHNVKKLEEYALGKVYTSDWDHKHYYKSKMNGKSISLILPCLDTIPTFYRTTLGLANFDLISMDAATTISPDAFKECTIKKVYLPKVKHIGRSAFYCCKLNSNRIDIPVSIEKIEKCAFAGSVDTIKFEGMTPPLMDDNAFGDNDWHVIVVPNGAYENYSSIAQENVKVLEEWEKSHNNKFVIKTSAPGQIKESLTDEMKRYADTLVISGQLYWEENEWLKKQFNRDIKFDRTEVKYVQSPEDLQRYRNQQKADRELAEKRRKYGVGSVSEGYSIGYNDGLGNVNNIMSYKYSTTPYYTEQFLDGYRRGFSRGQDELMKNTLRNMRSW